jgi:hypothetical protein
MRYQAWRKLMLDSVISYHRIVGRYHTQPDIMGKPQLPHYTSWASVKNLTFPSSSLHYFNFKLMIQNFWNWKYFLVDYWCTHTHAWNNRTYNHWSRKNWQFQWGLLRQFWTIHQVSKVHYEKAVFIIKLISKTMLLILLTNFSPKSKC